MDKGNKLTQGKGSGLELFREKQRQEKAEKEKKELEAAGLNGNPKEVASNEPLVQQEIIVKPKPVNTVKEQSNMIEIDPSRDYVFELIEKSTASRNVTLGCQGRIFDVNENRIRDIKYVAAAPTIYVEDMDASFIELTPAPKYFHNNYLVVPGTDQRLVEFCMAHDDNEDNPRRLNKRPPLFRIVDKELIERKKTEDYDILDAVRTKIAEKDADELRPLARIIFNIIEENDSALRNKLRDLTNHSNLAKAAENAKKVLDNITNPKYDRQYAIIKGFDQGVLELKSEHHNVVWKLTGTVVCDVRNTKNQEKAAGELAEWTLTSDVGQKFWDVYSKKVS